MSTGNSNRRSGRRSPANRGYGATLRPSAQISNTIATMNSMHSGQDLRTWSQSARKELLQGGTATLLVKKEEDTTLMAHEKEKKTQRDEFHSFTAPKLTMIVASPLLRDFFQNNPDKKEVKILHSKVTADAIRTITNWMKAMTTATVTFSIPMQDNISLAQALDIRVAAQILGMDQYVENITKRYTTGVYSRHPTVAEARVVLEHLIDEEDATLQALAGRLAHLRRSNQLTNDETSAWETFCARDEGKKLLDAVNASDVRLKEKHKLEAAEAASKVKKPKKGKKKGAKKVA